MKRIFLLLGFSIALLSQLQAQSIPRMSNIRVIENATLLRNPDGGGFNVPEFSPIDLDLDGDQDLFVWDRSGRKVVTFLNGGTANQIDYTFAPQFADAFPTGITDFALLADFDCDEKADLFFGTADGIQVYRNTSTPGNLSFQQYMDTLFTDYGAGPALVFMYQGDLPALEDIDFDGDLDLLAFNPSGTTIEWHKNMVMENTGNCAGLDLVVAERCWGYIQESGLNQSLTLGVTCRTAPGSTQPEKPTVHSGSSLAAFDEEGDGDYELVIGDLLYDGLTYCHNDGTASSANIDSVDATWPSYDTPVGLDIFPGGYFLDVNNDGKDDFLSAPNGTNISVNYDNSWYYRNVAPGAGHLFTREKKNFLTEEMIDVGLGAYPALTDINADGLLDLVIGNYSRKVVASTSTSSLTAYVNTGTASAPEFTFSTRNYANLNTLLPAGPLGLSPAFGDMDNDGDDDLIIGDQNGKLHYLENTATVGQPAQYPAIVVDFMNLDVGQFATPAIADIDRDGKMDLIVGELFGNLNYFRNIGSATVPSFSATPDDDTWGDVDTEPICCTGFSVPFVFENPENGQYDLLVGSEAGAVFYYKDIESELAGAFTLDQANFGGMSEGGRTAIAGADLTGDGQWEWLVGNVRGGIGFYSGNGPMTAMEPALDLPWTVAPNPSSGRFDLAFGRAVVGSIAVMDLQGRTVHTQSATGLQAQVDISHLPSGLYMLRLMVDGEFAGVKRLQVLH